MNNDEKKPTQQTRKDLAQYFVGVTNNNHEISSDFKLNILQGFNLAVMPTQCLQLENEAVWKGEPGIVGERAANESLPV